MPGIKVQTNVPQNSRANAVKILRRNEQKRARCGAQDGVLMPHIGSIFYIAGQRWLFMDLWVFHCQDFESIYSSRSYQNLKWSECFIA